MHRFTLLLVLMGAMVHGHSAAKTPAAQFWEQALPGSPMPDFIADRVRQGIDHSPLVEHHYAASPSGSLSACALFDSVCTPQMVADTGLFFHLAQLRPGNTMTLSFPAEAEPAAILPKDVAEKVPFANLDDVLATFDIPAGSAEAAQVRDTVSKCQSPPVAGEAKACATSLEDTVRAALRLLGTSHSVVATASELTRAGLPRQEYVVEAVSPLAGEKYVMCHSMPFPYAVYQCHTTEGNGYGGGQEYAHGHRHGAYKVSLRGLGGGPAVSLLGFCHFDTSGWNPTHPAFQVLHTLPGGDSPVCHFAMYGNLAFIKIKATTGAS